MSNFTPLTDTNKKKINKFFLIANLFLILLISIIGFVYYNQTLQPTKPGAAQRKCSDIDNQTECNASCSPTKSDGKSYACKWLSAQNKCIESGSECGRPPGGSGRCPPGKKPESDTFDHCNNCKAYCDCVDQVDIYYCPNYDYICENQNPKQCKKENNPTNTPIPTRTPTPTPTRIVVSNTPTPTPTRIISNTPTTTPIPTNTPTTPPNQPTNTPGPTATLVPVPCGTKDCDDRTNPCRSGYICVQAHDGSNYCASPDFADACRANPSFQSCCTAPGVPSPTPTEIIVARSSPTATPIQQMLQTGDARSSLVFTLPIGIILLGLLL
jgi:hypothetical protein